MTRFWNVISRVSLPIAMIVMVLSLGVTVYAVQSDRSTTDCLARWTAQYSAFATARTNAREGVDSALDALIRSIPTAGEPKPPASFDSALAAYLTASNAERAAEQRNPVPPASAKVCS